MLIDIRLAHQDAARHFSGKANLSGLRLWGETPFSDPVEVEGELTLRHGRVTVRYTVRYALRGVCARCLADVLRDGSARFSHPVREGPDEGGRDDIIPAPGGMLDMAQLVGADLLLSFTRPLLCKEDCQGLCPQCGADLNAAACRCAVDS